MASVGWLWETAKRAYRAVGGRLLGKRQIVAIRDLAADTGGEQMADLAGQAVRGEVTPAAFRSGMRDLVRNVHGSSYVLGRGGLDAMAQSDVRALSDLLRTQHGYLDGFVRDVEAGRLTEAQAMARARLYAGVGAFDRGRAAAWGLRSRLPEYPGDRCLGMSACRCSWSFNETADAIECTWRTSAKPCAVCADNGRRYSPFVIPLYAARQDRTPIRLAAVGRLPDLTEADILAAYEAGTTFRLETVGRMS